ncbi:Ig-like domain-containing protein [Volucribacter amazonae]|uniref:Bacterial Ig domain-containing protein n=1 Tax=Volucribacter amazonae TaxID=256731 RepID=A0A9X4PA04_9PAST|nr:Ig-like domain-containing protein [Volucribacter amazonae]MDG6895248.1 hypothetical protein [Volucribacter amazonae]
MKVTATDKANNKSDITPAIVDITAPEKPTAQVLTKDETHQIVSGTAEPESTIIVTLPNSDTVTTKADENGNYSVDIPAQADETEVKVTATNKAGNKSEEAVATVDTSMPTAEVITKDDDTQTVEGKVEPSKKVVVELPNGETVTTTADENGNYSVDIPAQQDGAEIKVVAEDENGDRSPERVAEVDAVAPNAPTAEVVAKDENTQTVEGTAEAGSTVTVILPNGDTVTTTADTEGNYSVDIPAQVNEAEIKVTATDKAGNKSEEALSTVDAKAPEAPTAQVVAKDENTQTVEGTAEAGSTVIVTLPNGDTVTTTADEEGNYSVDIPAQVNEAEIKVTATDKAGNKSEETLSTVDAKAPEAPTAQVVAKDENTQTVEGTAEAGSTVTVTLLNGDTVTTIADAEGNYSVDIPAQVNEAEIKVTATDKAGNKSEEAVATVDTSMPTAEVITKDDDTQTVEGKVEPSKKVVVELPNGETVTTIADENGNYSVDIPAQQDGAEIKVVAEDENGNRSPERVAEVDAVAPNAPTAEVVAKDENTQTVEGTAEADSTVTVILPNGDTVTTTADEEGNYSVDIPAQANEAEIKVTATDKAGNKSEEALSTVDAKAPEAPTAQVAAKDENTQTVEGTAEAGSTVIVTLPNGDTVTTTADEEGNYSVDIPAQVNEAEIKVTATDKAGNQSEETSLIVDAKAPAAPELLAEIDGSVTVTPPTDEDVASVAVKYTDSEGQEQTVVATKGEDGKWSITSPESEETVTIDADTGVMTIPAEAVKDGTEVTATATDTNNNSTSDEEVSAAKVVAKTDNPAGMEVSGDGSSVVGKTEPNAVVVVKDDEGNIIGQETADKNGHFNIPLEPALTNGEKITVVVDGEEEDTQTALTAPNTTAPAAPELLAEIDGSVTVTPPTDEDVASVAVKYTDSEGQEQTVVATKGEDGKWSITSPESEEVVTIDADTGVMTIPAEAVKDGTEVTATATDTNNNSTSDEEVSAAKVVAKTDNPAGMEVSGDGSSVVGKTEPNAVVVVKDDEGNIIGQETADKNGHFNIPLEPALTNGEKITVVVDGEEEDTQTALTAPNTTAPAAPELVAEIDGSVTVTPPTDKDVASVAVKYTDSEGQEQTVVATKGEDGKWSITSPESEEVVTIDADTGVMTIPAEAVKDGTEVTATATDTNNNSTSDEEVSAAKVVAKTDNPVGMEVSGDGSSVVGKTEPNAVVVVKNDEEVIGIAIADDEGKFSVSLDPALTNGETITVTINEGEDSESQPISLTAPDTTEPSAPTATVSAKEGDETKQVVSGEAEPNSTVTVTLPDTTTVTVVADSEGKYSVEIPAQEDGEKISVTATDAADNESQKTEAVVDAKAPAQPEFTDNEGSVEITPPSDTDVKSVTVKYIDETNGQEKTVVTTKEEGKWKITSPEDETVVSVDETTGKITLPAVEVKDGSTVIATVTDESGNTTEPVTYTAGSNPTSTDEEETKQSEEEDKTPENSESGSETDSETTEAQLGKPTFDAKDDGSVVITPPSQGDVQSVKVTYTDESDNPQTVTVTKTDGSWAISESTDSPSGVSVDSISGAITLSAEAVKDNSTVTAEAKGADNETSSDTVEAKADTTKAITDDSEKDAEEESATTENGKDEEEAKQESSEPTEGTSTSENEQQTETTPTEESGKSDGDESEQSGNSTDPVEESDPQASEKEQTPEAGTSTDGQDGSEQQGDNAGSETGSTETQPTEETQAEKESEKESEDAKDSATDSSEGSTDGNDQGEEEPKADQTGEQQDEAQKEETISDNPVSGATTESGQDESQSTTTELGKPSFDAKEDGSVVITPPTEGNVQSMEVQYTDEDGKTQTVTATKTGDSWEITQPTDGSTVSVDPVSGVITLPSGAVKDESTVTATAKSSDGQTKSDEITAKVDSDMTPPAQPTAKFVVDNGTQYVEGEAEANAKVTVTLPDSQTVITTADADGNYKTEIPTQADGTKLSVTATDEANNKSDAEEVTVDTQAPATPGLTPNADGSVTVTPPTDADVKTVTVEYTDEQNQNQTVVATKDGETWTISQQPTTDGVTLTVDSSGVFTIPATAVKDNSTVKGFATDESGNTTKDPATAIATENKDVTPPAAPELTAKDDGSVTVTPPKDEDVKTVTVEYTDETDQTTKKVVATKEDNGWKIIEPVDDNTVTIDSSSGVITIPATAVADGSTVSATATDSSDNTTLEPKTVKAGDNPDTTPPEKPTANIVINEDDSQTVKGTAEPGSTVTVKLADGTVVGTAEADAVTGEYEAKLDPAQPNETQLTVIATDKAGNPSEPTAVTVNTSLTATITLAEFDDTGYSADAPYSSEKAAYTTTLQDRVTKDNTFDLEGMSNKVGADIKYQISRDGTTWSDTDTKQVNLPDGTYYYRTVATKGGDTAYSSTISVTVDTTPPNIIMAMPPNQNGKLLIGPQNPNSFEPGSLLVAKYTTADGSQKTSSIIRGTNDWFWVSSSDYFPAGEVHKETGSFIFNAGTLKPESKVTVTLYNVNGDSSTRTITAPQIVTTQIKGWFNSSTVSGAKLVGGGNAVPTSSDDDVIFFQKNFDGTGAVLNTGAGDDYVVIGNGNSSDGGVQNRATINMGSGNDTLLIYDRLREMSTINMGGGSDVLEIGGIHNGSTIYFGDESDTLAFINNNDNWNKNRMDWTGDNRQLTVNSASGDGTKTTITTNINYVNLGDGNNLVTSTGGTGYKFVQGRIDSGNGNDMFDLRNSIVTDNNQMTFNTGAGDDVFILGGIERYTSIVLGAGDDTYIMGYDKSVNSSSSGAKGVFKEGFIELGTGNDTVILRDGNRFEAGTINLGDGDDTFIVHGGSYWGGSSKVNGGNGIDTVVISSDVTTITLGSNFNGFDIIKLTDTKNAVTLSNAAITNNASSINLDNDTSANLIVAGDQGSLKFENSGIKATKSQDTVSYNGNDYYTYTSGNYKILVDTDITVL